MTTTKARKIEFIEHQFSWGEDFKAIMTLFYRHGLEWLTDEQLDDIINDRLGEWKQMRRRNRENRKLYSSRSVMDFDGADL